MNRVRVSSSNLKSIGYDILVNKLEVEFLNNSVYQYFKVPKRVFEALMKASSHGSYFNRNIRLKYHYKQIK